MTRKRKQAFAIIGGILLLLVLALVFIPVWLPWILPAIGKGFGLRYNAYERLGYNRFALQDVTFTNARVQFQAQEVVLATPPALLTRYARGEGSSIVISNWSLHLSQPAPSAPAEPTTNTVAGMLMLLQTQMARLNNWISHAALTNGVIRFQQTTTPIPWLIWNDGVIEGRATPVVPRLGETPMHLSLQTLQERSIAGDVHVPGLDAHLAFTALRSGDEVLLRSTNAWGTNRVTLQARFAGELIPESAHLLAPSLHVPAAHLRVSGYRALESSLLGTWTNGVFTVKLTFDAASEYTNFPPITGHLLIRGDTNSATVEALHLSSPAVQARLSAPVQLTYAGELLSGPARLSITGELGRLPLIGVNGQAHGTLLLRPVPDSFPEVEMDLALNDVIAGGVALEQAIARGRLRWPAVELSRFDATLVSGAEIRANGVANLTNRFLSNATVQVRGQLPTNFIPASVQYSNLIVSANLDGPITNLSHEATVRVEMLKLSAMAPVQIELQERGKQFSVTDFRATAETAGGSLEMFGSGSWNQQHIEASLHNLRYWHGHDGTNVPPLYSLAQPVRIQVESASNLPPRVAFSPLLWRGDGRRIDVTGTLQWPLRADAHVAATNWRSTDFTNWMESPLRAAAVLHQLNASVRWSNGPVLGALESLAQVEISNVPPVLLTLGVSNTSTAVMVHRLGLGVARHGSSSGSTSWISLLSGDALLPLTVRGATDGIQVNLHSNAPLKIALHITTNSAIEEWLATLAKLDVKEPSLQVSLDGTWAEPRGTIQLSAQALEAATITNRPLPQVENLAAEIAFRPSEVELRQLRATVEEQPLRATAIIPLASKGDWKSRLQLDAARGRIEFPSANLAAFAPFATNLLAPRGTLDLEVTLEPGNRLSGQLRITDAATAPFPAIGSVHGIHAQVDFQDRAALVRSVKAHAGGAPLVITGLVNFANWKWDAQNDKAWPDVRLHVAGTNIALVRQSQKIIRTDLDLFITNAAPGQVPAVAGAVRLRDSLYLADLQDLVPQGVTKSSQRPPYFSVEADLLKDWPIRVRVTGEDFLRIRTPFTYGEVSTDLQVRGDLGQPLAVGEVRLEDLAITFPFTSLDVQQGTVLLTSENPYQPQLFITADGRAYGYDIHLEVTGTAQEPLLEFSSVPPLTSEQILMMVTTGQIPREDYRLSAGQRAQGIGLFLGKNLLSKLGFGGGAGRLSIRSGENISESGKETYSVEYKLTDDVSLIGEYDRFDEYNAGVKWRVFSR